MEKIQKGEECIEDVTGLRNYLFKIIPKIEPGTIEVKQANAISSLTDKVLNTFYVQIRHAKALQDITNFQELEGIN
jgi:hypothetical protein